MAIYPYEKCMQICNGPLVLKMLAPEQTNKCLPMILLNYAEFPTSLHGYTHIYSQHVLRQCTIIKMATTAITKLPNTGTVIAEPLGVGVLGVELPQVFWSTYGHFTWIAVFFSTTGV